jgi:amidase
VQKAAKALEKSGAGVVQARIPHEDRAPVITGALYCPGLARSGPEDWPEPRLRDESFVLIEQVTALAKEWMKQTPTDKIEEAINQWLPEFQTGMLRFMQKNDVILSPVSSLPAVRHGTMWDNSESLGFTTAMSLVPKLPAGVVRCGTSPEGLPIGVQVVAKPFREDIALAVMAYLEDEESGGWQPPLIT